MKGSQAPRIVVAPDGVDHPLWAEVVDFVKALGVELDEWQWLVLRVALRRSGDFWAAFTVAVCAPRQNGKNGILEIRELAGAYLLGEPLVIHSAHLADTSKEGFRRLDELIDANEWLSRDVKHIWRTNGHEAIEFRNGNRIRFRTRTRGGGRGFAKGSPLMFDEPMIFPEVSMGAIMPVASAHPDPQLWYTGSAVDREIHEDGVVFARVRHRALTGDHDRLAYFEWSLDYDTPDQVPVEVAKDPHAWAAVNPALGIRITPDYVKAEQRELAPRTFAVERLGVGDWPPVDGSADSVISPADWDALRDEESGIVGPMVFAFDVTPSRSRSSIGVGGRREDGRFHPEVVENAEGTGWVVGRLVEMVERNRPMAVVCDSVGPAATLVPELEEAGVRVVMLTTSEYAETCGLFFDAVAQRNLRHLGQPALDGAVRGAKARPLGERWAWDRKGRVDISPLVAVTQAVGYLAMTRVPQMFVAFA